MQRIPETGHAQQGKLEALWETLVAKEEGGFLLAQS